MRLPANNSICRRGIRVCVTPGLPSRLCTRRRSIPNASGLSRQPDRRPCRVARRATAEFVREPEQIRQQFLVSDAGSAGRGHAPESLKAPFVGFRQTALRQRRQSSGNHCLRPRTDVASIAALLMVPCFVYVLRLKVRL